MASAFNIPFRVERNVPLPYDYEVEYLESDGTQYIFNAFQMDFQTTTGERVYMRARFCQVEDPPSSILSGIFYAAVGRVTFGVYKPNGTSSGIASFRYGSNSPGYAGNVGRVQDVEVGFDGSAYYSVVDGVRTEHPDWTLMYDGSTLLVPVGILCRGYATGDASFIYSTKIRLYLLSCGAAELTPVVKDGRPCFYNRTDGSFLYSHSGTDFIAGPKVAPKIPYIETDGQAYVDLGFTPTENCDIELCHAYLDMDETSFMGANHNQRLNRFNVSYASGIAEFSIGASSTVTYPIETGKYNLYRIRGNEFSINEQSSIAGSKNPGQTDLQLFADPYWGPYGRQRIRYFKAWESGELVRDLVPYSGPRGIGMLDRVNDVLYQNANTIGTLTYGEE